MAHKYLNDIGISSSGCAVFNTQDSKDDRMPRFLAQREKYGFDERETWNLDWTMAGWLYSHLKMLKEVTIVDLDYRTFKIPVLVERPKENTPPHFYEVIEDMSERECLDLACEYLEKYLLSQGVEGEDWLEQEQRGVEYLKCAIKIIAEISPSLWW